MSDRPILFSAPMVRAILREIEVPGTGKTQTRRIIKERANSIFFDGWTDNYILDPGNAEWRNRDVRFSVGDRLWVREAWKAHKDHDIIRPRDLLDWKRCVIVSYDADDDRYEWLGKRRPGMFMPRWASRITLEVTDVRVERLQEISEEDARAEGAEGMPKWGSYRNGFNAIWIDINGVDSWNKNPWVSAITFRPHLCNIDAFVPTLSSGLEVREVEG